MSPSLIGRLGSSAFRPSTITVSTSLAGSRFSSESAPRPLYGASFVKGLPGQQILLSSSGSFLIWKNRFFARITIRGEPAIGHGQSRHNLVSGRSKDPNHDADMRIGSEAPKRRTHSSSRRESQGACRDSVTSNRNRRSVTSVRTRPKLSGAFSVHWGFFQ
jgi:hypothetical protein